jgi:membrane fusion protein (multidrug efflux system)
MNRSIRTVLTAAIGLAAAVFLGQWLYFRQTHVVSSYAFVKGSVVQVGAPVEGQVATVEVRSGQRVNRGDVLVRLNDVKQRAIVDQARAAWQQALVQKDVERLAVGVQFQKANVMSSQARAKVQVNEAAERAADIDSQLASRQAGRSTALRDRDMVSEADHDVAATMNDVALQKVAQARGRLSLAEAQIANVALQEATAKAREARLSLLDAMAATAKATLDAAEADLSLTVIRAPESGVVSRRLVEPAAGVRVGTPLLEVWYDTDVAIEAWIDESKYGDLAAGMPVEASLTGGNGAPYAGRIEWLGVVTELELKDASFSIPIAKTLAQAHWVRALIALDHPDALLLPGLTMNVAIPRKPAFPVFRAAPPAGPPVSQAPQPQTPVNVEAPAAPTRAILDSPTTPMPVNLDQPAVAVATTPR